MPSWKVHREIGEIVCLGFSDERIDEIIDFGGKHDSGRYDPSELRDQFLWALSNWGPLGGIYYLLHHVLDRLSEILVSELCKACEEYLLGKGLEESYEEVLKNSWARLTYDFSFPRTWDEEVDEAIKRSLEYILAVLRLGWEAAISFLILDVNSSGEPTVGRRVEIGMISKIVAYRELRGFELEESKVREFLVKLGDLAAERARRFKEGIKVEEDLEEKLNKAIEALEKVIQRL